MERAKEEEVQHEYPIGSLIQEEFGRAHRRVGNCKPPAVRSDLLDGRRVATARTAASTVLGLRILGKVQVQEMRNAIL